MTLHAISQWQHAHSYGVDEHRGAERRTTWVIALTVVMMVAEIAAGVAFGSAALLADGSHMGTHAAALGITVYAYRHARRNAGNAKYTFGTGKVSALGGFASAVGLGIVALLVSFECAARLASPVPIQYGDALVVATTGLVVNLVSAAILHGTPGHDPHGHARGDESARDAGSHSHDPRAPHSHVGADDTLHRDHNLRGAYLHVIADALTSVLAIVALLIARYVGWLWVDPAVGIVGAVAIARWSSSLLRDTSAVLLDAEVSAARLDTIRRALEADGDTRVADLHVWRVGPRHLAAIVAVVGHEPRDPEHYKALLAHQPDLVHVTVEVNECRLAECR